MTRKEALRKAITYLRKLNDDSLEEIIAELELILQALPITEWDLATTLDAIDQFYLENGRYPIPSEFKGNTLPGHRTIKHRYQISPSEFLDKYYSDRDMISMLSNSYKYRNRPKEYWIERFRQFVLANPNVKCIDYNKLREGDMPCLVTMLKIGEVNTWGELKMKAGLPVKNNRYSTVSLSTENTEVTYKNANKGLKELQELLEKLNL